MNNDELAAALERVLTLAWSDNMAVDQEFSVSNADHENSVAERAEIDVVRSELVGRGLMRS